MTTQTQAAPTTPSTTNGTSRPNVQPPAPQVPQQAPAQAAPPPDATAAELKTWQERAAKAEALAAQKTREEIVNRRKWETERKTFGEKLKTADEYERLRRDSKVSPLNAVSKLLGVTVDKALELLNTVAANGNAPTAESIAQALADQEAATEAKFKAREEQAEKARADAEQKAVETARAQLHKEATEFCKALAEDYPIFAQLGDEQQVGAMLAQRIEAARPAFARYRGAVGNADGEARVALMKAAADAMQTQILTLTKGIAGHDKYKSEFASMLTPVKVGGTLPPVVKSSQASSQGNQSSQPRRSLGNDLTGSTPGDPPKFRTEEERIKAARAVGQAFLNKQS